MNQQTAQLAASLLAGRETDRDGVPALPALPTAEQREALTKRGRELATALMPGNHREMVVAISKMLMSLGNRDTESTAQQRVTAYVDVVKFLPLWAVQRACGRFERGDVTAEELGERSFSRGFCPTTAQLYIISSRIVQHFRDEQADIREVLRAKLIFKTSPEERERVKEKFEALKTQLRSMPRYETPKERQYRERAEQTAVSTRPVSYSPSPQLLKMMEEQDAARSSIAPREEYAEESR